MRRIERIVRKDKCDIIQKLRQLRVGEKITSRTLITHIRQDSNKGSREIRQLKVSRLNEDHTVCREETR